MIVALAGGVGGAKLADGLARALPAGRLAVIINTADDFELYDLHISPDADTVLYTLAGIANPETGWGIVGDTFALLDQLARYGVDTWFRLGDRDMATHVHRTHLLRSGATPSDVLAQMAGALGVTSRLLPMTDDPVGTVVTTPDGDLPFQEYFVRRRHADEVRGVRVEGVATARVTPQVAAALDTAEAVILCPSNPFVSIGPILQVPGMRERIDAVRGRTPIVAVSPIIAGRALKGPADTMLRGLGHEVSALGIARVYRDLLDGLVLDASDAALAPQIEALGMRTLVTNAVMASPDDRDRLARETLAFAETVRPRSAAVPGGPRS